MSRVPATLAGARAVARVRAHGTAEQPFVPSVNARGRVMRRGADAFAVFGPPSKGGLRKLVRSAP